MMRISLVRSTVMFCAFVAVTLFSISSSFAQIGGGGLNFARQTSTGVWSDSNWTADGASAVPPGASDAVFIGDSSIPVSGGSSGPPSFNGTVVLSVDGASQAADELHIGNVALSDTGILNLNTGANLNVGNDLTLNQGTLNITNGDLTAGGLIAVNGSGSGTINVGSGNLLSASTLTFDTASAIGNLDGTANVTNLNLLNGASIDSSGATNVTGMATIGGNYNLDTGGTLNAANLSIVTGGSLSQNGGNFVVDDLVIAAAETVTIESGDSIADSVMLSMGATLIFSQDAGELTGLDLDVLSIETGSTLQVNFDSATEYTLGEDDWILRVSGDVESLLDGYIADGRISTTNTAGFFDTPRNEFALASHHVGGFTYLTAVPEPTSLALLFGIGGIAALRRRRR